MDSADWARPHWSFDFTVHIQDRELENAVSGKLVRKSNSKDPRQLIYVLLKSSGYVLNIRMDTLDQATSLLKKVASTADLAPLRSVIPEGARGEFDTVLAAMQPRLQQCAICDTMPADNMCGGCKSTFYCSDTHAAQHWSQDHAQQCQLIQTAPAIGLNIGLAMEAERELIGLNAFKNKNPPGPFYFVMYGPPGSGKSAILATLMAEMGIPAHTLIRVLIDEYVEQFTAYSGPIVQLKSEWKAGNLSTEDFIDRSEKIYWDVRKEGAEIVEQLVLQRAREMKYHVLKETTGGSVSSLLEKKQLFARSGYQTILVYPFVTKATLLSRIALRAAETGRYPDPAKLEKQIREAQENFLKVYSTFDIVIIVDNEKVFGEGGTLVRRVQTAGIEQVEPIYTSKCNVRQAEQYIKDGSLIPEFANFIRSNC